MNRHTRDIPSLTGLRGLAALWVFTRHYTNGTEGNGFWPDIALHGGANGVMIFFVLSGFILSHVYADPFSNRLRIKDYLQFVYFRFARIYPLHFATLIIWLVLFGVIAPRPGLPDMSSFTFLLNIFLVHAWGAFPDYSWNAPSWTISVEWAIYLIFPFAVPLLINPRRHWVPPTVIGAITLALYFVPTFLKESSFNPGHLLTYSLMFIAGMAAYHISMVMARRSFGLFFSDLLVVAGVGLLILTCSLGHQYWLTTISATLLIVGLHTGKGVGHRLFGNRAMVFFGNISYSLYMTHIMVIILAPTDWPWMWPSAIAILVASAGYFLIERPSRAALHGLWDLRKKVVVEQA